MSAAGGPGGATHDDITCGMLLAVHGAVFMKEMPSQTKTTSRDSILRLKGVPYQIMALALEDIGKGMEAEVRDQDRDRVEAGRMGGSGAKIVCLVSPSKLGYSVMNSENYQFPNQVQAFVRLVEKSESSNFDGSHIATFFSEYDRSLYSFFDEKTRKQRDMLEQRFAARTPVTSLDVTNKLLTYHSAEMPSHDFNSRMQTIRNALGLNWKPHYDFCIDSKKYCPGGTANQCCLFFSEKVVGGVVFERLRSKLFDYNRQKSQPTTELGALGTDLRLEFNSDKKCVLTIIFNCDSTDGLVKNKKWRGITLDQFFRQVKQLLGMVFSDVDGFDVERVMARTCVVDAACSDFSVSGKEVSIIGFEKTGLEAGASAGASAGAGAGVGAGVVSALVDVHDHDDEFPGFWEYWVRHKHTPGAGGATTATATATAGRKQHRVYIPRELEEFVPECLTSRGATIRKFEPIFDDKGIVVRVKYTYFDGRIEEVDYAASEAAPSSDSMKTAFDDSLPNSLGDESLGSQRSMDSVVTTLGGGRRRRSQYSNSKKRYNKNKVHKRKTIRRRKITRKMVAKGRLRGWRRTCARRL